MLNIEGSALDFGQGREEDPAPRNKMGVARWDVGSDIGALTGTNIGLAVDWSMLGSHLQDFGSAGVAHLPTVVGHQPLALQEIHDSEVLFTFNEPNNPNQANLSPSRAAALWPQIERAARAHNIRTLVGPSLNYAVGRWHDPEEWYDAFFGACRGCRVDAIAIHVYNCNRQAMKARIDKFRKYGKQIWITEMACADDPQDIAGNTQSLKTAHWQCQYMQDVIPYLESEPLVDGYFWFSYGTSANPHGYVGESALIDEHGHLTDLGHCYSDLSPHPSPHPPPAPPAERLTCDHCERRGHSSDQCGCGVCGSFGFCSYTCTAGSGRVGCETQGPAPPPPTPPPPPPLPPSAPLELPMRCQIGDRVTCHGGGQCSGNSCCPDGSTCPSARKGFVGCPSQKIADCTHRHLPHPFRPRGPQSCAENPGCRNLGLVGDCCSRVGVMLACCHD